MSETLSYQEPQNVTTMDNLTAEEQDSLQVGEQISQQEEQVYAGKYKSAQELEKAYMELQSKLGEQEDKGETEVAEKEPEDKPTLSEGATLITSATDEYYANGNELSPETLQKFSSMSSQDLIKAYMEVQQLPEYQQAQQTPVEISESQVNQIKNAAGGEAAYSNIINWAKSNLEAEQINAFDDVVNTGSVQAINLAVAGLKAQYDNANGVEGRMVTGKAPTNSGDVFRSQQELVAAMNDVRYDRDPAYRQDVIEKLDRSNLEF
tara:strand:- start:1145 stop:1936 length:792 start_codon:yes stop_codon:yes gene_type:complete